MSVVFGFCAATACCSRHLHCLSVVTIVSHQSECVRVCGWVSLFERAEVRRNLLLSSACSAPFFPFFCVFVCRHWKEKGLSVSSKVVIWECVGGWKVVCFSVFCGYVTVGVFFVLTSRHHNFRLMFVCAILNKCLNVHFFLFIFNQIAIPEHGQITKEMHNNASLFFKSSKFL